MSVYDKNHYNTVISLQLIKINGKKTLRKITAKIDILLSYDTPKFLAAKIHFNDHFISIRCGK